MIGKMLSVGWTLIALTIPATAVQAQSAKAIVDQAAKAMGGINALHHGRGALVVKRSLDGDQMIAYLDHDGFANAKSLNQCVKR
ncbi:MAG: hypothetical protein ACXWYD_18525 [Candidatus Binatia bacterium]